MDYTLNEIDGYDIQSYPYILFFSSKDKVHPIKVELKDDLTSIAMLEFLKKHVS